MFKKYQAALALLLAEGGTPSDCRKLSLPPEEIYEELSTQPGRDRLSKLLDKDLGPVRWDEFDAQMAALERIGGDAVCLWDDAYPDYLHYIAQAPPIVFYKGAFVGVYRRGVAVVGSRKPSAPGAALARSLGRELAAMGIPVVSGLARGIDSAAHRGSIEGGGGGVAVIGTGLDIPYPPENAELMLDMSTSGCVVTEARMGSAGKAFVFPLRNRLISAFSHAVVVVEAGERSGALITAKWALEQGRDVGAVPGFPGNFRSRGTSRLLKQGAFVVESASDVLAAVPRLVQLFVTSDQSDPTSKTTAGTTAGDEEAADRARYARRDYKDAQRLLAVVGNAPVGPDELARHVGMDAATVQRLLLHLEMAGRVERDSLGRYTTI
ncbi:MAG: DNA-processing protein DprA [Candidatus Krumholzibacteria bacterium]|nr:DNA-processing protein DprA [Candidatus Krumholzibacteria bacterium]